MIKIAFSPNRLHNLVSGSDKTLRQIADELGHPNTTRLCRYKNGQMLPSADTIAKLASILDCHPQDLLAEVEV